MKSSKFSKKTLFFRKTGRMAVFLALFVAMGATLSACLKTTTEQGYVAKSSRFDQIREGISSREEVLSVLGSPSSTSTFGKETWYYIAVKSEHVAFLEPEMVQQEVVLLEFNDAGMLEKISRRTRQDARDIAFAEEKTPTEGNRLGVAEQLLGNLGRFNSADQKR